MCVSPTAIIDSLPRMTPPMIALRGCPLDTLCGISSRFQLLSPTERQVSHALLTRSPLSSTSINRNLNPSILVRLACVRHAASVRPEPGSNSQKMVSKMPMHFKSVFKKICLANFTQEFRWLFFVLLTLKQFHYFLLSKVFCSSLRYSIYKVHAPDRSQADSLVILSQGFPNVNNFFTIFQKNFSELSV